MTSAGWALPLGLTGRCPLSGEWGALPAALAGQGALGQAPPAPRPLPPSVPGPAPLPLAQSTVDSQKEGVHAQASALLLHTLTCT
jgi:hypothetical protein